QQFHRAAVDFAGDGARCPTDRPGTQDEDCEGVNVADGDHVRGVIDADILASHDGLDDLPRSLKDHGAYVVDRQSELTQRVENLARVGNSLRDPRPENLKCGKECAYKDEAGADIAQELVDEYAHHASVPWNLW